MTNKPMLSVERELLATAMKADASMGASAIELVNGWAAMEELRALLDRPVNFLTPDCPDCACVQDGQCLCIPSKPASQHQGEPVAIVTGSTVQWLPGAGRLKDRTPLYAEQPAPVAVVMPEDWEDQLFAEMSRRFDLRKQIDDDHMVYDDTQIGVEFARDWIKARLNDVKP